MRVCQSENFIAPAPDQGLIAWADESLDVALAPRGGPAWQEGRALVVDAFEAAMAGNEPIVVKLIRQASAVVQRESRRACACLRPANPTNDGFGRERCSRCHGRLDTATTTRGETRKEQP